MCLSIKKKKKKIAVTTSNLANSAFLVSQNVKKTKIEANLLEEIFRDNWMEAEWRISRKKYHLQILFKVSNNSLGLSTPFIELGHDPVTVNFCITRIHILGSQTAAAIAHLYVALMQSVASNYIHMNEMTNHKIVLRTDISQFMYMQSTDGEITHLQLTDYCKRIVHSTIFK